MCPPCSFCPVLNASLYIEMLLCQLVWTQTHVQACVDPALAPWQHCLPQSVSTSVCECDKVTDPDHWACHNCRLLNLHTEAQRRGAHAPRQICGTDEMPGWRCRTCWCKNRFELCLFPACTRTCYGTIFQLACANWVKQNIKWHDRGLNY